MHSENMGDVPQKMYSTKRVIRNEQQKKYMCLHFLSAWVLTGNLTKLYMNILMRGYEVWFIEGFALTEDSGCQFDFNFMVK